MRFSWRTARPSSRSDSVYVLDVGSALTKVGYANRLISSAPSVVALAKQTGMVSAFGRKAQAIELSDQQNVVVRSLWYGSELYAVDQFVQYVDWLTSLLSWLSQKRLAQVTNGVLLTPLGMHDHAQQHLEQQVMKMKRPLRLERASLAMVKLAQQHAPGATLVVDIGAQHCGAVYVVDGAVQFKFGVPWGMQRLQAHVVRVLHQKGLVASAAEVGKIMNTVLDARAYPPIVNKKLVIVAKTTSQAQPTHSTIQGQWFVAGSTLLVEDVLRTVYGWLVQSARLAQERTLPGPKSLLLIGGGAQLSGWREKLAESLQLKVSVADDPVSTLVRFRSTL